MTIRALQTDDEITVAFPLMAQLRDRIRPETFLADVRAAQSEGYELIGGFDDGARLVVLAGLRCTRTLSRGRHVFVDDLVTDQSVRGKGCGRQMLQWIAQFALDRGMSHIHLDSRDTATGFYEQLGFTFSTSVPCRIEAAKLLGRSKETP
jgi:GNAT superfamily N-acetyltransferase